jgi:small conductance mechanosensitive channel
MIEAYFIENIDRVVFWLEETTLNFIKAIFLVAVGWFAAKWAKRLLENATQRMGWDEILWGYASTALRYLVLIVLFTSALNAAGFPVGSLLATFGISGVIIGLGARQSISNYFFGLMMLSARPFKQGDLIEFGPPPQVGVVREVKMTYTALDTLDNVRLIVPNSVIWRNKITNFSVHTDRAIRIPMSMPYDVNVGWVKDLALDVLKRHEAVLNDPEPQFTVSDVTALDVKVLLVAWSNVETMTVFGDVITQMRKEFETAGLAVTVPSKDIDLKREE